MRKLASIQRISKIEAIPGADKIVKATVLGWDVIVQKEEFSEGDLCIYFEIDSVLPPNELWDSFLKRYNYRIKTIRLKGQLSQGLALPVSALPKLGYNKVPKEGEDLTAFLNVRKYETPSDRESNYVSSVSSHKGIISRFLRSLTKKRSEFPSFISKTDEIRVQSLDQDYIDVMRMSDCYATEKLDGQSATFAIKSRILGKEYYICSRNRRIFPGERSNWVSVFDMLDIKNRLSSISRLYRSDIAIQGEIIGPSIQGNKYGMKSLMLFIFNVKDLTHSRYFTLDEMVEFCNTIGIPMVPILDYSFSIHNMSVSDLVEYAKGTSVIADVPREGVVIRDREDLRKSFKVINNDFLEKYDL